MKKILIIGAGNLGSAIAKNLSKSNYSIKMVEKCNEKLKSITVLNLPIIHNIADINLEEYTLLLCIKPHDLLSLKSEFNSEPYNLISTLAGVSTQTLTNIFPQANISRVMPNLSIVNGASDTVYMCNNLKLASLTHDLFSLGGNPIRVHSDHEIDIATGLVGTSPAICLYIRDILADCAIKNNIPTNLALQFANSSIKASYSLVEEEDIISKISSKGGTTEAALIKLKEYNVNTAISSALDDTFLKCKKINNDVAKQTNN